MAQLHLDDHPVASMEPEAKARRISADERPSSVTIDCSVDEESVIAPRAALQSSKLVASLGAPTIIKVPFERASVAWWLVFAQGSDYDTLSGCVAASNPCHCCNTSVSRDWMTYRGIDLKRQMKRRETRLRLARLWSVQRYIRCCEALHT